MIPAVGPEPVVLDRRRARGGAPAPNRRPPEVGPDWIPDVLSPVARARMVRMPVWLRVSGLIHRAIDFATCRVGRLWIAMLMSIVVALEARRPVVGAGVGDAAGHQGCPVFQGAGVVADAIDDPGGAHRFVELPVGPQGGRRGSRPASCPAADPAGDRGAGRAVAGATSGGEIRRRGRVRGDIGWQRDVGVGDRRRRYGAAVALGGIEVGRVGRVRSPRASPGRCRPAPAVSGAHARR